MYDNKPINRYKNSDKLLKLKKLYSALSNKNCELKKVQQILFF